MKFKQQYYPYSIFLLLLITVSGIKAQTIGEIMNSSTTKITYLGIDFSEMRLIGDPAAYAEEIKSRYFSGINGVVLGEPKKYDLPKVFKKADVASDITAVEAVNAGTDASKILSNNSEDYTRFNEATIATMVNKYNLKGAGGVGVVLIVESLNKTKEKGAIHLTFIDMASKKVLYTERMEAKCGGFGFRNYWAKSVYGVLKEVENRKAKDWLNK